MYAREGTQEAKDADPPPLHAATVSMAGKRGGDASHAGDSSNPLFRGNPKYLPNPPGPSPMAPRVSMRLLDSLNLALMDDGEGCSSGEASPRSEESHESAATTVTCSTAGSRCATP